jgi:GxxExxY protein
MPLDVLPVHNLTSAIIGSAIEVHRALGPGLLESAYQRCLAREMWLRGLYIEEQLRIELEYKGQKVIDAYRIDFRVERKVLVELKSVDQWASIHEAQMLTYLRIAGLETGLLINFNVPVLKDGVRRILNRKVMAPLLRSSV